MKLPLKVGIIGCGHSGRNLHTPALKQLPLLSVSAVADVESTNLEKMTRNGSIPHCFKDYRDLLQCPAVDIVAICVPPHLHAAITIAALEAGKHVLVEKPLALSLEDCDRIIKSHQKSTCKATVGFNLRYHRLISQAKTMIDQGLLGKITSIQSRWMSHHQDIPQWRQNLPNPMVFEIAVHHFDLWRFLSGQDITAVQAIQSQNAVAINAHLGQDIAVNALFSQNSSDDNVVEIYGTTGKLSISLYRFDGLNFCPIERFCESISNRVYQAINTVKHLPHRIKGKGDFLNSYSHQWQMFYENICDNKPLLVSLQDGKKAIEVANAVGHSIKSKDIVSI